MTVDQALQSQGLSPIGGEDGRLTVSEFKEKHKAQSAPAPTAE